jgi:hypothetical protein
MDLPACLVTDEERDPHWIAGVNDTGTKVALHCVSDFKVYSKQVQITKSGTSDTIKSTIRCYRNPIHCWSCEGHRFELVEMGGICSDEIIEISFD